MRYKKNPQAVENMNPSELNEIYDDILFVHKNNVTNNKECISFAYKMWHENFRDPIHHLINKFPKDSLTSDGCHFWSGTKRFPIISDFDFDDQLCIDFVHATANLWADVFSLKHLTIEQIKSFLNNHPKLPNIKPLVGDIIIDEKQLKEGLGDTQLSNKSADDLPQIEELDYDVASLEFEKDDDENFHIDFITSASNLRAMIYRIEPADKFKTKGIAGKIIPALVTTTSLVAGMACMELMNFILGNKLEMFNDTFINLALPLISFSTPKEVKINKLGKYSYSIWDVIEVPNVTTEEIIKKVNKYIGDKNVKVSSINAGQFMLYSTMTNKTTQEKKLKMKISDIYTKALANDMKKNNVDKSNNTTNLDSLYISIFFDVDGSDPVTCKICM